MSQTPEEPAGDAAPPGVTNSTMECTHCATTLSYPPDSAYIQCPKCTNTMNPSAPQTNYINCVGCGTLLSHPPSSLTIQCPKCYVIMELSVVRYGGERPNSPGRKAARKKRKHPDAPKRASNAYMIFCKERRAQLKKERPDLPFGKLGAKLGELWRDLSAEEKRPYENRAAMDRERYKQDMNRYQAMAPWPGDVEGEDEEQKQNLEEEDEEDFDEEDDEEGGGGEEQALKRHQTTPSTSSLPSAADAASHSLLENFFFQDPSTLNKLQLLHQQLQQQQLKLSPNDTHSLQLQQHLQQHLHQLQLQQQQINANAESTATTQPPPQAVPKNEPLPPLTTAAPPVPTTEPPSQIAASTEVPAPAQAPTQAPAQAPAQAQAQAQAQAPAQTQAQATAEVLMTETDTPQA